MGRKALWCVVPVLGVLMLLGGSPSLQAWNCLPQRESKGLPPVRAGEWLLLDADDWGRDEVMALRVSGTLPLAWVNLLEPENWRPCFSGMDPRTLVIPTPRGSRHGPVVRFYLGEWRSLLQRRLRELAGKGFAGVVLGRLDRYPLVTDHPVAVTELVGLIDGLAAYWRSLVPTGKVVLHAGLPLADRCDGSSFDGLLEEGLFRGPGGRKTRTWDRSRAEEALTGWALRGKRVLLAEQAVRVDEPDSVPGEIANLGWDAAFLALPLKFSRRSLP